MANNYAAAAGRKNPTPEDFASARGQYFDESSMRGDAWDSESMAGSQPRQQVVADALNAKPVWANAASAIGLDGIDGTAGNLTAADVTPEDMASGKYAFQKRGGLDYLDAFLPGNQIADYELVGPDSAGPDGKRLPRRGVVYEEAKKSIEDIINKYRIRYGN